MSLRTQPPLTRGSSAVDALLDLVHQLPAIEGVEFLRINMPPSVEGRPGATARLRAHAAEARRVMPPGDSFTETFMTIAEASGDLESALDVIGFHQPLAGAAGQFQVSRRELSHDTMINLISGTPASQILVVTSRVMTARGSAHLPLLDFKMASGESHDAVAMAVAARLGGGVVLDSGSSYHLYGDRLVSDQELQRWLLEAQLLTRCVDTRWVTHQLIEQRAALRLAKGGGKAGTPSVIGRASGR